MAEAQSAHGTTDITPLLQPLRVGRLTLKNRFVMPGMQRAWCEDGAPTVKLREYYRRRAEGGTALVVCEACAVDHPSAASNPMFARLDDRTTAAWRGCVDAVHEAGGRVFLQLWHQGAFDTGKARPDFTALSPSGLEKPEKDPDRGLAAWVKEFTDAPVIAVGSVGLDVDVMATLTGQEATPTGPLRIADLIRRFERGDFDLISVGRSLIGDPDWVTKMRDGRGAEIRPFRRSDLGWLT